MPFRCFQLSIALAVLALPVVAVAGPCDVHFTFDGNLSDSGGNGLNGEFVDSSGEPVAMAGEFVPGKFGQALRFDGETIIFSELNLQTETCPQVSVTGWIFLEGFPKNSHALMSTGFGRGPRLAVSSTNLSSYGGSNEIRAGLAVRPGIWIFVAGVWDYTEGTHRLYWRHRSMEEPLGDSKRRPQEGLWIGAYAYGSSMLNRASGILIDDLKIHGKALTEDEIHTIRDAERAGRSNCNCGGVAPQEGATNSVALEGAQSCQTDSNCSASGEFTGACYSLHGGLARCYQRCDYDNDCADGVSCLSVTLPAGTLDGICSNEGVSADSGSPLAGTLIATGPGRISDAVTDTLTEHMNENRAPDITYDSEEEGVAAAEAAAARREQERRDSQAESDVPASGDTSDEYRAFRATGPASVPGVVAGFSGYNQHPVDLEDRFVRSISWSEGGDRPCHITIVALDGDVVGREDRKVLSTDLGCDNQGDLANVRMEQAGYLINRLQVCNNNNANRRMKGLRISGEKLNPDGTATNIVAVDTRERPNCAPPWSRAIECPTGEYATGLVIHANDANRSTEQIVGLQLICRRLAP